MRQWYGATINVVRQGIWFAIIVVLWFLGVSLGYVIAGRVLAAVIESGLIWGYSRRFLPESGRFLRERAATIFSHSFPIAFTALLSMIYLRIDQVMLHKMVSDSVLGQYVAAVKVSELFEMLPSGLMVALAPVLSVSVAEPERFRSFTDRAFRYFMLVACGLCVFMTAGARIGRSCSLWEPIPAGGTAAGHSHLVGDRRIFRRRRYQHHDCEEPAKLAASSDAGRRGR